MPRWTIEQETAINETGKNIIVSAGAGSGKTAVLTERVIRKLKNGVSIKNMLILTFTNNAAHEMKERIRNAIKKEVENNNNDLKKELDYIDNAYITTFDSFALSTLKKYHYLLNIGNDISIIDSNIIDLKKEELLEQIFEEMYFQKDEDFLRLINLLCVKDDTNLKSMILNINNKIDLLEDKYSYLDSYIENYFSQDFVNNIFLDYTNLIIEKINTIRKLLNDLSSEVDGKYIDIYSKELDSLFKSSNYTEIRNNVITSLSSLRGATDLGNEIKKEMVGILKEIDNRCYYSEDEIKSNIYDTKDYVFVLIKIIKELNIRLDNYKRSINKYEFNDISIMAINIVKNNSFVREELKNSFNEICVDEYQDTSDLQESFINLISNNNVYMVGDIKQSIYRFRNANPILFKNKYDNYSKSNGGMKIDLVKNFRSRFEVLHDINTLFNLIMDNNIGGAEYSESHNMVFGNTLYVEKGNTEQNNNLEIYNYEYDKEKGYKKEEIEAFIIAKDIKDKIANNYKIFDKNDSVIRDIEYKDFVILMDRTTSFDLYKKIFEYVGIPTTLYKDENIVNEDEIYLVKNIVNLVIKIKEKIFDNSFKHSFLSIARSYLCNMTDDEIFRVFSDNKFSDTLIYKKCLAVSSIIDNSSNVQILEKILEEFDIMNNFISVGNIDSKTMIIDYLINSFSDLDSIGYGIDDVNTYLDNIISKDKQIKVNMSSSDGNTVKIMTIHKSKGLEYHICYFCGFDKPFNLSDLKEKIIFDNKYGIIVPFMNEGLDELITKYIVKENYIREDISERIRLLYVAVTRAKEKMIIVGNFDGDNSYSLEFNGVIDNRIRGKYRSFKDVIMSIKSRILKYFVNVDLDNIGLTHNYNLVKDFNIEDKIMRVSDVIKTDEIFVENEEVVNKHFSKENVGFVDEIKQKNMSLGTYLHELFESIDFKKLNFDGLSDTDKEYVNKLLSNDIFSNISNAKIYKEYEFVFDSDREKYHGIIDLMLEYDDHIDIVDYKLMNTTSTEYVEQLNGYKNYIENSFGKSVNLYLYSIINNELVKL